MQLEYYPAEKIKKELLCIIAKYLNLNEYRVFFFGSRVAGSASERSDIDVGIEGSKEVPALAMVNIREKIEELPTLYKIDIVDFKNVPPGFKKIALQSIEPINLPAIHG